MQTKQNKTKTLTDAAGVKKAQVLEQTQVNVRLRRATCRLCDLDSLPLSFLLCRMG